MVFWWDMDADPYASTRPVEIIGTLDNINKAEKLISSVIAEVDAGGSPSPIAWKELHVSIVVDADVANKSKEPLSFAMRLKFALASAKGILYLHTEADPPIFHRDIKASNILLDSKYTAKVVDFGLLRLAPVLDLKGTTPGHVSTVVKGTLGYLDPEYFLTHKLTDKSDVYSLGRAGPGVSVALQAGRIYEVIDDRMGSYPSECVVKFFTLALKCCEEETDARPSMAEVTRELEGIWLMMPDSDIRTTDPMVMTPPSSSSMVKNPYVPSDVFGRELVSGVVPYIAPR
uniref:Protein kinase domain-containing protein n=1 Tax=Fagus sylvatica TaxID=28930 RepID=A0A2N9F764_FAGSY